MASDAPAKSPEQPPAPVLPLGYFKCRKRIALLKKFQNLIRHRDRWATSLQFTPPIETLIPKETKPEHQQAAILREINKLTMPVSYFLKDVDVTTIWTYEKQKPQYPFQLEHKPPEIEKIKFDIVLGYFDVKRTNGGHSLFDGMMRVLEQGIGTYEFRQKAAFWELFNPAIWIAHIIRLPMWILHRAGFAPSQKFYEGFIKSLVLVILAFGAVRLGLVTWKDLTPHLLKWLGI